MNERLQGWKLALALLVPALIIGAAGYIAYDALSEDDQNLAVSDDEVAESTTTPTATALPLTAPVQAPITAVAEVPTALPIPTATPTVLAVEVVDDETTEDDGDTESDDSTPEPAPAATAVPAATSAPAPAPAATTAPAPAATSGPAPTATPDPNVVTVACSGDIPADIATGQVFGPLTAVTTPAEVASGFSYFWDFGNSTNATSPGSGGITYSASGSYVITLTATDVVTGEQIVAACGTATVADGIEALDVKCSISTRDGLALAKARPGDFVSVNVTWKPTSVLLDLQYEFESTDPIVFSNQAASGDSQEWSFASRDAAFKVFWRHPDSGATGRLTCPAYPGAIAEDNDPNATPTPGPTPTTDPTVDSDGDGVEDVIDTFPNDPTETADTDGDGIGNTADTDDDGDGVLDADDQFPLDGSQA